MSTFTALLGQTPEQLLLLAVRQEVARLMSGGFEEEAAWGTTLMGVATWGLGFLPHARVFSDPDSRDTVNAGLLESYRKLTLQAAGRLG